jgi:hypothetical protein
MAKRARALGALLLLCLTGCHGLALRRSADTQQEAPNVCFVTITDHQTVWERTVAVVHDYFEIARENRLDGVIETQAKVGASVFEPWHRDTVGLENRLEATLQSVRRRAFITVAKADGGHTLTVEVLKEREDGGNLNGSSPNGATFEKAQPTEADLSGTNEHPAAVGWISLGRDKLLEERIARDLKRRLSR